MTVRFEATFEDYVDVQRRFLRASPAARRMRRRDITLTTAFSSIGVFAAVMILSRGRDLAEAVVISTTTLVIMLAGYPPFHDWWVARRMREFLRESYQPGPRNVLEVTLDEAGVHLRSSESSSRIAWNEVRAVNDTPEGVEFMFDQGLVMTRSRAFETADARARFIQLARGFSGLP